MEDRYLFKAKRIDNGEWVQGYLVYDNRDKLYRIIMDIQYSTGTCITTDNAPRVDSSTICQCTGLKDKNGKLIWENDIVTGWFDDKIINGYIMYGSNATFFIERKGLYGIHLDNSEDWLEVIGNIFDNPELLEV